MTLDKLTYGQLIGAVVVILILVGAYTTIMKAVQTWREEKRIRNSPIAALQEKVERHDALFTRDKVRLDEMEARITEMGHQSTIMLRGVRALLSHEINGNSVDKLTTSATEIDDYLISRK